MLDREIWFGGDDNADRGEEGDEDGELDDEGEDTAERFDVVAFIEVHGLEGFELTVAFAVFLDFGYFGLEFFHQASLVKLFFDKWPHSDFDEYREDNNSEAEVADVVINNKK